MSPHSAEQPQAKDALRKELREKVRALGPETRAAASAQIRQRLAQQPVWQAATSVLLYAPQADEPDLWPLVDEALAAGRKVALPRYSPQLGLYEACLIRRASADLESGQFGILEPNAGCPRFALNQLDLALVPGVGFGLQGGRLGRGNGFYDRLLAGVAGFKCGVGFDCQVAAEFPLEAHDVRLNCILTPTLWHVVVGPPRS